MKEPILSQSFSVEVIHKIRHYHGYLLKTSPEKYWDEIRNCAEEGHRIMAEIKARKAKEIGRAQ